MPATPERALRVAILGCGHAAELNGPVLRAQGAECWYASRDLEKARHFASRFGGRGAFGSYREALTAAEIDAVLVATPPATHTELTLAALAAGKHVVVEKPPFLRSADFDPVESAARAAGRRVHVAENYHYKPVAKTLRRLLADRVIGDVLFVHVNALKKQTALGWRGEPAIAGGGPLFEGGIHWVSFMSHLGPVVNDVRGFAAGPMGGLPSSVRSRDQRGVMVVFDYEGGAVGTLLFSWEARSALNGVHFSGVYGREGSIAFESNGLVVGVWGRKKRLIFPGVGDLVGRRAMWRDFLRSLTGGPEPEYDLAHARRDLERVERIYRSLE